MSNLLLGIDTGGTYTDGVLLDERTREVVATTKTLTTRHDLAECMLAALDALLPEDPRRISLASISTTLATNAIAEGKGRPIALFLLGYDPDLVKKFKFEDHFATSRYQYFQGGHDLNGEEQAPLDVEGLRTQAARLSPQVEAFAVSGYFSPFNPVHEEIASQIITEATGRPVVLGHQLSSRLNSVQRATTASLNASLLSILAAFMGAMQQALDKRGVMAPLMVMRGDGALMSASAAKGRPVETVHSGPAASAIGGRVLAGLDRGLVIDIGGTTTDLAMVDGGRVRIREQGTTVGRYHTAVRAADVRSIGLGGDSVIGFNPEGRLTVGPQRVTPISYLAHILPTVGQDLKVRSHSFAQNSALENAEYWFLQREPGAPVENDRAREVISMLRQGPMPLREILERLTLIHPLQFDGEGLLRQEIVGCASLTPTDLLHLTGEFAPWDAGAAEIAATMAARLAKCTVKELTDRVMALMAEAIVAEVVSFLSQQTLRRQPERMSLDDLGVWLFEESLYPRDPYLRSKISLKVPIIGIGAPAAIFLPRVAELLHTDLVTPPHYHVANAVGAVTSSVTVTQEAWIYPRLHGVNVVGYYAQAGHEHRRFSRLEDAVDYARQALKAQVLAAAEAAGAADPHLEMEQLPDGAESYRLRALAMGNPRLGEATG
jgi:N-methylhydantoinase A/oxoprolinase/acetone carboxylase beta subunit